MSNISMYTLNDILDPFGSGISTYNKSLIMNTYMKKFNESYKMMSLKLSRFKNDIYIHIKYPSDNKYAKGVYYDIVFQFKNDTTKSIMELPVKVFSNSPSFMYTYTYAWKYRGGLSETFIKKCSQIALTEAPIRKNPNLIIGFDESLWMGAQYIKSLNIRRIDNLFKIYPELSFQSFYNNIASQENKKHERDITEKHNKEKMKSDNIKPIIDQYLQKNKGSIGSKNRIRPKTPRVKSSGSVGTKRKNK